MTSERAAIWFVFLLNLAFVRALVMVCAMARPRKSEWVDVVEEMEEMEGETKASAILIARNGDVE